MLKCYSEKRVTDRDERWHDALQREARVLYGRHRHVIGGAGIQQGGRTFDAFQHVLGQPSVYGIVNDQFDAYHWRQLWSLAESALGQAIGRLEAQARRSRLPANPEAVARWAKVINFLEGVRVVARWLLWRPRVLVPLVEALEGSPVYKVAQAVSTIGGAVLVFLVAGVFVVGVVKALS